MYTKNRHPLVLCLKHEIEAMRHLLENLRAEYEALGGNDPARIEGVLAAKAQTLAELDGVEKERERLMEQAGFDPRRQDDPTFVSAMNATQRAEVMRAWSRLIELGEQCMQQNLVNGALVQNGLRQAQQLLGMLRGQQPDDHASYGPAKASPVERTASRALGKA